MGALGGPLEIRNKVLFQESEKVSIGWDVVHFFVFVLSMILKVEKVSISISGRIFLVSQALRNNMLMLLAQQLFKIMYQGGNSPTSPHVHSFCGSHCKRKMLL